MRHLRVIAIILSFFIGCVYRSTVCEPLPINKYRERRTKSTGIVLLTR